MFRSLLCILVTFLGGSLFAAQTNYSPTNIGLGPVTAPFVMIITNSATATDNQVPVKTGDRMKFATQSGSVSSTNGVKIMSAQGGGASIADMQAATSDNAGQLGVSFPGSKEMALWSAAVAGTGSNAWDRAAFDFFQGIYQDGHPYLMPSITSPGKQTYVNGSAALQTRASAPSRAASLFSFVNMNPFTDGNGINLPMLTTNLALAHNGVGSVISTNADGQAIYFLDPFGLTILAIAQEFSEGETNQAGMYVILTGIHPERMLGIGANLKLPGESAIVNYSQHSFVIFDGRAATNTASPHATYFPWDTDYVWSPTNANWRSALAINHKDGSVAVGSNAYFGGAIRATNNLSQSAIGPSFYDVNVPAGLFVTTNVNFSWNLGTGGAWTFDGYSQYRWGIIQQSGLYPKLVHGSTAPFAISRGSNSQLTNALGGTLTDELSIDASGNMVLAGTSTKLSTPSSATTVVNLGLAADGTITTNAAPVGSSSSTPSPVWTNGFSFVGVASNNITIDKLHSLIATGVVQSGSSAITDSGQYWLYSTNGHLSRLQGVNVEGVDQPGFTLQLDSSLTAAFGTNHAAFWTPVLITNRDGRIYTSPTNLFEIRSTNGSYVIVSNDMTMTLSGNLVVNGNITVGGVSGTSTNIQVTGTVFANNAVFTNGEVTLQTYYLTNSGSALTPDFSKGVTYLTTNAAFTFLAPVNVSTTNDETTVTDITNSTASVVAITCPTAGLATGQIKTNGTWNVTNLTRITWHHYGRLYTNAVASPIF